MAFGWTSKFGPSSKLSIALFLWFLAGRFAAAQVLVLTIDTLRSDRLSCYGNAAPLTPAIDRLSRRLLLYEQAYTVAPLTLPAHASLLTGLLPREHGARNNGFFRLARAVKTIPEDYREAGYLTGAFVSSYVLHRSFGLDQGFSRYDDVSATNSAIGPNSLVAERPGETTVSRALAFLSRTATLPFFLWVHLYEPHAPYDPSPPFGLFGQYDGEVASADYQAARLLRALPPKVKTLVAADHGESLGAHSEPTHGTFLYQETIRIPLLRSAPEAGLVESPIGIAEALPRPGEWSNPMPRNGRARPLIIETLSPELDFGWSPLHAVVSGCFKAIRAPTQELYDLCRDPKEQHNLAPSYPALAKRLDGLIGNPNLKRGERRELSASDREALKSLGYLAGEGFRGARGADPKAMTALLPLLGNETASVGSRLDAALRRDPGNRLLRLRQAWWLLSKEKLAQAETVFQSLADENAFRAAPYQGLAACMAARKDFGAALRFFRKGRQIDPGDLSIAANIGELLVFSKRFAEAVEPLEAALDDPALRAAAAANLYRARTLAKVASGWRPECETDPNTLRRLADAAARLSHREDAATFSQRAAFVEQATPAAILKAARTTAISCLADAYVDWAVMAAPADPDTLLGAAEIEIERGNPAKGKKILERLSRLPTDRATSARLDRLRRKVSKAPAKP